jgi:hypothetical protein
MYTVKFYFNKTETGGYESCMTTQHYFFLGVIFDVMYEYFFNKLVKGVEVTDKYGKTKIFWGK